MDTPDWMNSVNLAFSPKKIDVLIIKTLNILKFYYNFSNQIDFDD